MYVIEFIHLVCISLNFKYTSRKAVYRKHTGEVDVIVSAALFIKNNGDAVFDDHFFLYHEEADMQLRLVEKWKRRLLIDGPEIIHLGDMSDKPKNGKYARYCSVSRMHDYISRLEYHRKNKKNPVCLFFLKVIVLMLMAFPPLLPETKKIYQRITCNMKEGGRNDEAHNCIAVLFAGLTETPALCRAIQQFSFRLFKQHRAG